MMSSPKTVEPFPYIFKSSFDFGWVHSKDKIEKEIERTQKIIDEIGGVDTPEKGGGITSVILRNDIHNIFGEEFHKHIDGMLSHVWDQWHLDMGRHRYISESWINKHPTGAWTEEHYHHNVVIASVAYLYAPHGTGNLMVKNPFMPFRMGEPLDQSFFYNQHEWTTIPVKTNDIVFFPGWLSHKTEKNKVKSDRYIMSMNFRCE